MDFMFEDDVDEVGSDVEAYCPKCKADTTHVVISKYEDEIRRVQCNPCGDVHSFRKPRGETEDDVPEPVAARKRALLKKPGWDDFFARKNPNDAKPYEFREHYRENVMVNHPKFGVGFVSEVVSDSKVEITFRDARRILVHNRRDIPGLPLAAEGDGVPTPTTKSGRAPKEPKEPKEPREPKESRAAKEARDSRDAHAADAGKDAKAAKSEKDKAAPAGKAAAKPLVNGKSTAPVAMPKAAPVATPKAAPVATPKPAPVAAPKAAAKPTPAAAKPAAVAKPEKAEAKGKPAAVKAATKPAKAAPRGAKTAAKSAAKKPATKPKKADTKKAGKKR
jgi:hypothetical protein